MVVTFWLNPFPASSLSYLSISLHPEEVVVLSTRVCHPAQTVAVHISLSNEVKKCSHKTS